MPGQHNIYPWIPQNKITDHIQKASQALGRLPRKVLQHRDIYLSTNEGV